MIRSVEWASGFPDERLVGVEFAFRPYRTYSADWDHDHCAVCHRGFSEAHPGDLHEGYATTADFSDGAEYEWVCTMCFAAQRESMRWRLVDDFRPARAVGMTFESHSFAVKEPHLRD